MNTSYSDFRKYVRDGQASKVTFEGNHIMGHFKKPVKKGPPR